VIVPSLAYKRSSMFFPSFVHTLVSSLDDDNADENLPPLAHLLVVEPDYLPDLEVFFTFSCVYTP
jgi:hypothetical protein